MLESVAARQEAVLSIPSGVLLPMLACGILPALAAVGGGR
jgi:hypothetical protein